MKRNSDLRLTSRVYDPIVVVLNPAARCHSLIGSLLHIFHVYAMIPPLITCFSCHPLISPLITKKIVYIVNPIISWSHIIYTYISDMKNTNIPLNWFFKIVDDSNYLHRQCVCILKVFSVSLRYKTSKFWTRIRIMTVFVGFVSLSGHPLAVWPVQGLDKPLTHSLYHSLTHYNNKQYWYIDRSPHLPIGQTRGCLRGLDNYHPCSNLGMVISEECFIFDFASLPLEVARPI